MGPTGFGLAARAIRTPELRRNRPAAAPPIAIMVVVIVVGMRRSRCGSTVVGPEFSTASNILVAPSRRYLCRVVTTLIIAVAPTGRFMSRVLPALTVTVAPTGRFMSRVLPALTAMVAPTGRFKLRVPAALTVTVGPTGRFKLLVGSTSTTVVTEARRSALRVPVPARSNGIELTVVVTEAKRSALRMSVPVDGNGIEPGITERTPTARQPVPPRDECFDVLGPLPRLGRLLDLPPRNRIGKLVAPMTAGAPVGEPPGRAERSGVERVVRTRGVDEPGVTRLVPQVVRLVARRGRRGLGRIEVAQVGPGLVAVGAGGHRIG